MIVIDSISNAHKWTNCSQELTLHQPHNTIHKGYERNCSSFFPLIFSRCHLNRTKQKWVLVVFKQERRSKCDENLYNKQMEKESLNNVFQTQNTSLYAWLMFT